MLRLSGQAITELRKAGAAMEESQIVSEIARYGPDVLTALAAGLADDEDEDPGATLSAAPQPCVDTAAGGTAIQTRDLKVTPPFAKLRGNFRRIHKMNVQNKVKEARMVKVDLKRIRKNTQVAFWGLASVVAMILSHQSHIGLLHAVGLDPPDALDVIVTGLSVGAGTQPLNKVISALEK